MSIQRALATLFGRYSFDQHTDQALALAQSSATQQPLAGRSADPSPLRLIPPVSGDTAGRARTDSPGAASHPIDWDAARDDLDVLRILLGALADTCADVIEHIDHLDPTPAGLAQAAADSRT